MTASSIYLFQILTELFMHDLDTPSLKSPALQQCNVCVSFSVSHAKIRSGLNRNPLMFPLTTTTYMHQDKLARPMVQERLASAVAVIARIVDARERYT